MITDEQLLTKSFFIIRLPELHFNFGPDQPIVMSHLIIEEVVLDKNRSLGTLIVWIKYPHEENNIARNVRKAWCFINEEDAKVILQKIKDHYEYRCKEAKVRYNLK